MIPQGRRQEPYVHPLFRIRASTRRDCKRLFKFDFTNSAGREKVAFEQKKRENWPDDDTSPDDTLPDDGAPVLDTLLIRKDMNECIRGIVESLPDNYRSVLVLSEFEGLTNAEMTEIAGISLDTVKIRLHRARTRLRKELETK